MIGNVPNEDIQTQSSIVQEHQPSVQPVRSKKYTILCVIGIIIILVILSIIEQIVFFKEQTEEQREAHRARARDTDSQNNIAIFNHQIDSSLQILTQRFQKITMFELTSPLIGEQVKRRQTLRQNFEVEILKNQNSYKYYIVISQPFSELPELFEFFEDMQIQEFTNWTLIYYYRDQKQKDLILEHLVSSKIKDQIIMIQTYGNNGANFYDAFNNQMPKKSVAVMIGEGQSFENYESLQYIVNIFEKDPNVYILASAVQINSSVVSPSTQISRFKRYIYPLNQSLSKTKQIYQHISMHVRVFKVDHYRDIMPFDLLKVQTQQFYNSKNAFLFPLLQMSVDCSLCKLHKYNYDVSCSSEIPVTIFLSNQVLFISRQPYESFEEEGEIIFEKITYNQLNVKCAIYDKLQNGRPNFWGMDINTTELNLFKRKFPNKQRIPRILHQCWVSDAPMNDLKTKIVQTTRQTYKNWQYKLWTKQNITRENFPKTFDIIQKLMELDKTFPYLRLSMVTDLMRYQILYQYGGVYVDINYQAFQTLEKFRKYPLILGNEDMFIIPKAYSLGHCGSEPFNPILGKIISDESLSKINLQGRANVQTGPHLIGKYLTIHDLFYNVKILPTEIYLPYMGWAVRDRRFGICKCRVQPKKKRRYRRKDLYVFNNLYTVLPCQRLYNNQRILGVDHFYMGASWREKRFLS